MTDTSHSPLLDRYLADHPWVVPVVKGDDGH